MGTQTTKAQVHVLPTDKAVFPNCLWLGRMSGKLYLDKSYPEGKVIPPIDDSMLPQHLYFTTDEEIKEGDWYINLLNNTIEKVSKNVAANWKSNMSYNNGTRFLRNDYKKIVATTNPELWKSKTDCGCGASTYEGCSECLLIIPKIDIPFIEAYIKAYNGDNPIKEVLLEIKDIFPQQLKQPISLGVLKLKSNGSVIIHPVKERMFTRTEVRKILGEIFEYGISNSHWIPSQIDRWFNKNYPE